jgi:hypothetical protein
MWCNLDEIRERLWKPCAADIVALIAEVETLRRELADAKDEAQRWRRFILKNVEVANGQGKGT